MNDLNQKGLLSSGSSRISREIQNLVSWLQFCERWEPCWLGDFYLYSTLFLLDAFYLECWMLL